MRIESSGNVRVGDYATSYGKLNSVIAAGAAVPTLGTGSGHLTIGNGTYGLAAGVNTSGNTWMQAHRFDGTATSYDLILQPVGGRVVIGAETLISSAALTTRGNIAVQSNSTGASVSELYGIYDSANVNIGYFGYASASNSDLYMTNLLTGGQLRFFTSLASMTLTNTGILGINTDVPGTYMAGTKGICVKETAPGVTLSATSRDYIMYINGTTFSIYDRQIPADVFKISAGGNVAIGSHDALCKFHTVVTDGSYSAGFTGTTKGIRIEHSSTESTIAGVDHTLTATFQPLNFTGSQLVFSIGGNQHMWLVSGGSFGVGTSSPLGRIDSRATSGAQIVASSDATNYASFTASSAGVLTIEATGDSIVLDAASLRVNQAPAGSAGSATGTYLTINLNGTDYKVALLANA